MPARLPALSLLCFAIILSRCTAPAVQRAAAVEEKTIEVTVLNAGFGAEDRGVGQAVTVRVRARSGRVLREVETDREGFASLTYSWTDDDPPLQIEAVMDDRKSIFPTGTFVGSIVNVNPRVSSYCITLPSSCVF